MVYMCINIGVRNLKRIGKMSKLAKEISMNKAAVIIDGDKKDVRRALTQSMLDSVSGGWVNVFARWSRRW